MIQRQKAMLPQLKSVLREFKDVVLEGRCREETLTAYTLQVYRLMDERPLTRKEAAAFLGVSLTTFDKYRHEGRIIEHYPGGKKRKWAHPRFLKSELLHIMRVPFPSFRR